MPWRPGWTKTRSRNCSEPGTGKDSAALTPSAFAGPPDRTYHHDFIQTFRLVFHCFGRRTRGCRLRRIAPQGQPTNPCRASASASGSTAGADCDQHPGRDQRTADQADRQRQCGCLAGGQRWCRNRRPAPGRGAGQRRRCGATRSGAGPFCHRGRPGRRGAGEGRRDRGQCQRAGGQRQCRPRADPYQHRCLQRPADQPVPDRRANRQGPGRFG